MLYNYFNYTKLILLDFETLFSELHQYHGLILQGVDRQEGVGGVVGVGGKPKAG